MIVNTTELTGLALDWAVAKAEGRCLAEPTRASNADVENLATPFTLYDVMTVRKGDTGSQLEVRPITVVRYGIDDSCGATTPSITFIGADGRRARGSVNLFYLTAEAAQVEADQQQYGSLADFHPSTDCSQGDLIIDREGIGTRRAGSTWYAMVERKRFALATAEIEGPTRLIAALRCHSVSKLGGTVEIPEELLV